MKKQHLLLFLLGVGFIFSFYSVYATGEVVSSALSGSEVKTDLPETATGTVSDTLESTGSTVITEIATGTLETGSHSGSHGVVDTGSAMTGEASSPGSTTVTPTPTEPSPIQPNENTATPTQSEVSPEEKIAHLHALLDAYFAKHPKGLLLEKKLVIGGLLKIFKVAAEKLDSIHAHLKPAYELIITALETYKV